MDEAVLRIDAKNFNPMLGYLGDITMQKFQQPKAQDEQSNAFKEFEEADQDQPGITF